MAGLSNQERIDRLRLIRTENVGPITFAQLLRRFGTASEALKALPLLARRGGRARPLTPPDRASVEAELDALARLGGHALHIGQPDYPRALAEIDDAPPVLCALGHVHLLERRAVAVVGARNASLIGRRFAETLAGDLAASKVVVVSGLARGIDAAAHAGALARGTDGGGTVAVMAGGVDVVYPEENRKLYERIKAEGVILSEIPLGIEPQGRHFPRRNRIISGLCAGVVVVEAAEQSGSLITARMALEQGREVFAVPGSPLDPRSTGANRLIRQGASLTEGAHDVLTVLDPIWRQPLQEPKEVEFMSGPAEMPTEDQLAEARAAVIESLSPAPIAIDELVRAHQLSAVVVRAVLLELELAGRIERQPGNRVALA
ncbi:MAG: DNA-protecting protein DprA [Alphaproteobacteria bacterium]|nr:DNA-protecting protein DprA [Alphaproteobacteria bacterium]